MNKTAVVAGTAAAVVVAAVAVVTTMQPPPPTPFGRDESGAARQLPPTDIHQLIGLVHVTGCKIETHPVDALGSECVTLRAALERAFEMHGRLERRVTFRETAAVIRARLKEQRARNPKAAPPPGIEEYVQDLDTRAKE